MLNSGRIDHTGPGRLWVELARQWAGVGLRVARADLSGLGDSPPRAGSGTDIARPRSATQDIDEIARALCPDDTSEVILMGLCSGAHLAVEAALTSSVGGVVALNVVFPIPPAPVAYQNGEPGGEGRSWPPGEAGGTPEKSRIPSAWASFVRGVGKARVGRQVVVPPSRDGQARPGIRTRAVGSARRQHFGDMR